MKIKSGPKQRLQIVIPIVLVIIFVLLYMTYHSAKEALTRPAGRAVRPYRGHLSAEVSWLQLFRRGVGRIHRSLRHCRSNRCRDGDLSGGSRSPENRGNGGGLTIERCTKLSWRERFFACGPKS